MGFINKKVQNIISKKEKKKDAMVIFFTKNLN